ncbi:hypothetical protein ABBQ38_002075 [Trebouxia sp. C0009 RCD-2024]
MLQHVYVDGATAKGKRNYQQDRHIAIPDFKPDHGGDDQVNCCLVGVFDGHKSEQAAVLAAAKMPGIIAAQHVLGRSEAPESSEGLKGPDSGDRIAQGLKSSFKDLDDLILAEEQKQGVEKGAFGGCTAVIALVMGDVLYTAHVGDSGAIIDRSGTAYRLTEDHKPYMKAERQRIQEAGGQLVENGNRVLSNAKEDGRASMLAMSRALGDADYKDPKPFVSAEASVRRLDLLPEDKAVIIASDGLWDVIGDQDVVSMVDHLIQEGEAEKDKTQLAHKAAQKLVQVALQRGTADNVTALVMLPQWS